MESQTSRRPGGELSTAISDAMVKIQKDFGGRGPSETRTHWAGGDMLVVLMGGGFTMAEETMYQGGDGKTVREARHTFQDLLEERTKDVISALTGRKVVALMTATHQSPDLTALMFVLASEADRPVAAQEQLAPEG